MGPPENRTKPAEKQEARRRQSARRPRIRRCLLKGCEQRFHPRQVGQRYCSQACREAARQWSRWKAQQAYRATSAGQEFRSTREPRLFRSLMTDDCLARGKSMEAGGARYNWSVYSFQGMANAADKRALRLLPEIARAPAGAFRVTAMPLTIPSCWIWSS